MNKIPTLKKKILFAGCSFTANCGFTESNRLAYHWTNLLANHYDCQIKNIAKGGMSNEEIFLRTSEEILNHKYDLVVVMWSTLSRKWVYCSDRNIDDFTILNKGLVSGFNNDDQNIKLYAKIHYSLLNNTYVDLKNWLVYANVLERILTSNNQPFMFIKGSNNLLEDFKQINWNTETQVFDAVTPLLDTVLDLSNRPDDYILEKLKRIKNLIDLADNDYWLNFSTASFNESAIDVADDNSHPGIVSNKNLFEELVSYIDKRSLI